MKITKKVTPYNFTNKNDTGRIKYIVIHYFGGLSTAKSLADYWASKYIGASAHYAVGHAGDIYQCVEDEDIAWHCGATKYKHASCRNTNSIGIEMAVRKKSTKTMNASDKDWYFEPATVRETVALTKELMAKYKIPVENVIRHYEVTGKNCPNPYVINSTKDTWDTFKKAIAESLEVPPVPEPPVAEPPKTETPQKPPAASGTNILYRIRRSWQSPNSQLAAYRDLGRAEENCPKGYKVFDETGKAIYDPEIKALPYEVVSTADCLNIRYAASEYSQKVGSIRDKKRYTIVEESKGWGKLQSGKGWIKLSYTKKVE